MVSLNQINPRKTHKNPLRQAPIKTHSTRSTEKQGAKHKLANKARRERPEKQHAVEPPHPGLKNEKRRQVT
jgi:hypothetical protein